MWWTRTFFKPADLPWAANAGISPRGVAAAPWMNTVSPDYEEKVVVSIIVIIIYSTEQQSHNALGQGWRVQITVTTVWHTKNG